MSITNKTYRITCIDEKPFQCEGLANVKNYLKKRLKNMTDNEFRDKHFNIEYPLENMNGPQKGINWIHFCEVRHWELELI